MNGEARSFLIQALRSAATLDRSISEELCNAALNVLEGRWQAAPAQASATGPATSDRVLSRIEAAQILHCSTKSISRYAAAGIIRPVRFGSKAEKAIGYSAASVDEALRRARSQANA